MTTLPMQGDAFRLERRGLLDLGDAAGLHVACSEGLLWLTLDHDPRDILLEAVESFYTTEHRRALVYALQPSRFTVRRAAEEPVAVPQWRERAPRLRAAT